KPVAALHNARPATERSAQPATTRQGRTKKPLHRVLTFSETALRCAAPLTETASGPRRQGRLKSTPHRVLTEAKVALQCAAPSDETVADRHLRRTLKKTPAGCCRTQKPRYNGRLTSAETPG